MNQSVVCSRGSAEGVFLKLLVDAAGANAAAASVAAAAAGAGAMHDINSDAPPQLDQLSMDPAALLAGRNLRPATDASRAGMPLAPICAQAHSPMMWFVHDHNMHTSHVCVLAILYRVPRTTLYMPRAAAVPC